MLLSSLGAFGIQKYWYSEDQRHLLILIRACLHLLSSIFFLLIITPIINDLPLFLLHLLWSIIVAQLLAICSQSINAVAPYCLAEICSVVSCLRATISIVAQPCFLLCRSSLFFSPIFRKTLLGCFFFFGLHLSVCLSFHLLRISPRGFQCHFNFCAPIYFSLQYSQVSESYSCIWHNLQCTLHVRRVHLKFFFPPGSNRCLFVAFKLN